RVVVWFGDAPGHDPVCTGFTGLASHITTSSVISEPTSAHIRGIAISLNTGGYPNGLNDDQLFGGFEFDYDAVCGPPGSDPGAATASVNAPGGQLSRVASASDASNAIVAGLQTLPVTVTPTPTCDSGL